MKNDPVDYARALLSHLNGDQVQGIEDLVQKVGLTVRDVDSTNFEGALITHRGRKRGIIAVKRSIREPGRRNFTIAHELGHYVLPGHGMDECYCKSTEIESWQKNVIRAQEFDANSFASETLLPSKALYPLVNQKGLTLALAKELSVQFTTSLTATLMKCAEVSEETCAVVCSVNGEIVWTRKSEGFHLFIPYARLSNDMLAGRLLESGQRELTGEVLVSSWIDNDSNDRSAKLWEESILLPNYDTVLSILTIES